MPGIFTYNISFTKLYEMNAAAKSLQSCPTLCNPVDGSPPGSAVPGILQARTLGWVAVSFSSASKWKVKVQSLSRDPMDRSPPGSSVHGIFQARVLEWGSIAFSLSYAYMYNILFHDECEFKNLSDIFLSLGLCICCSL